MSAPEFHRPVDRRQIVAAPLTIEADAAERAALAARFGLVAIRRLSATLSLSCRDDVVTAQGRLSARIVQSCAVSGEDLPVTIEEPITFRFVPEAALPNGEELEIDADQCDEIGYTGHAFDLGEAVAQTLALAIDPYACGPDAERVRREQGITDRAASGVFAALAALKRDPG